MKRISIFLFSFISMLAFQACKEEIDESNRFTLTGETIEDYLSNRSERFSSFNYILTRISYDKILSAYGEYTCFAPNNDAVQAYIDSLYDDTENVENPHNGMTERGLEGLTDSLCKDIALFHLLNTEWRSIDMNGDNTIPTMLGRDINAKLDQNTGKVVLNREAQIDTIDVELVNGILHEINHVITRSNRLVPGELENSPELSIFNDALIQTGLADSLKEQVRSVAKVENSKGFYVPEECKVGYTIFAETNEALQARGIDSWQKLAEYANEVYGRCAVSPKNPDTKEGWYDYYRNNGIEVSTGTDYKKSNNALNMFIRYHIVKYKVNRDKLVYRPASQVDNTNKSVAITRVEYLETMLPFTLIKFTSDKDQKIYANRWVSNTSLTDRIEKLGTDIGPTAIRKLMPNADGKDSGVEVLDYASMAGEQPLNGCIHPLKDMLVYNWDVPNGVLNERMRFDFGSILGDVMSNGFRHTPENEVKAWNGGKEGSDGALTGPYIRIPSGFCSNLRIYNDENTRLLYMSGIITNTSSRYWNNYQNDEFNCLGRYDFAVRMPPVPDGTYELRIGYTAETKRGMMQFYLGEGTNNQLEMKAIDIPLDMRIMPGEYPVSLALTEENPCPYTGWFNAERASDKGIQSDANMRNLGFMRGSLAYNNERFVAKNLRRILLRERFEQKEYWLRFKSVLDNDKTEFHMDYIELCPASVYNNSNYAEDMF